MGIDEVDAAAQLALYARAKRVFETTQGSFLSFPVHAPIGFAPSDLDFSGTVTASRMRAFAAFSRMVNMRPEGTIFIGSHPLPLWEAYDDWISTMTLASVQITATERTEYQTAGSLLSAPDARGLLVESPPLASYNRHRALWFAAHATGNSADLDQALKDWEKLGHKQTVENAIQRKLALARRDPLLLWREWRDSFPPRPYVAPFVFMDAATNTEFAPTYFAPYNIFSQTWPRMSLNASEIALHAASAPLELRTTLGWTNSNPTVSNISWEWCLVNLERPWFRSELFSARFWKFGPGTPPLSDGGSPPQGSWPGYITGIVFVRNILSNPRPVAEITLMAGNGRFLCAVGGGGQRASIHQGAPQSWQTFLLLRLSGADGPLQSGELVALRANNGQYLCAEDNQRKSVVVNRNAIGPWETFTILHADGVAGEIQTGQQVALRASHGEYVCAEGGGTGRVFANRNLVGSWERFTIGMTISLSDPNSAINSNVSVLAFRCERIPRCPHPDPTLPWPNNN